MKRAEYLKSLTSKSNRGSPVKGSSSRPKIVKASSTPSVFSRIRDQCGLSPTTSSSKVYNKKSKSAVIEEKELSPPREPITRGRKTPRKTPRKAALPKQSTPSRTPRKSNYRGGTPSKQAPPGSTSTSSSSSSSTRSDNPMEEIIRSEIIDSV